ncbi:MAG: AarF/UbiB family protein [Desulfomonilaceae bacterium]|jgi:predicted unusual protein kinase regulating ubiquinone biosynthesis (AarF/ABC1/UbiB family)
MVLPIKTAHLKRYRDIALLLVRYGFYDIARKTGLDKMLEKSQREASRVTLEGEELARDLETLGPTFVKLGQFLSTRPDILPREYVDALGRLQSEVKGFPFEQAQETVKAELGTEVSVAFKEFDPEPIAAASIGQVHRALTLDGRTVVVKVQRPNIRETVMTDLEVIGAIAGFVQKNTEIGELYGVDDMFQEFNSSMLRELDYLQEMRNLITLRKNLQEFNNIVVPIPIEALTTQRILTMGFIEGTKITLLSDSIQPSLDRTLLLEDTFRAYLKQILVDGFFHADPHPGNLVLTKDGRIGILDLGMVARITPGMREKLIRFLVAMSNGEPEDAARIAASIGEKMDNFDASKYYRRTVELIFRYGNTTLGQIQMGKLILEFTSVARECGIRVPKDLAMLGKTILQLDQVAAALDPDFDPNSSLRKYAGQIMLQYLTGRVTVGNVISGIWEFKDSISNLPKSLSSVLEQMAINRFQVKVDLLDENRFVGGMQKIANRITLGLLLASLIIGAGLMARLPTTFQILGYPAIAIIFFLIASAGAVILILHILIYDEKPKKLKKK